jgi:hypothetical protein
MMDLGTARMAEGMGSLAGNPAPENPTLGGIGGEMRPILSRSMPHYGMSTGARNNVAKPEENILEAA